MRAAIFLVLAASPLLAHAVEMLPIPAANAYCADWGGYCYEWEFIRDKSLRFIAHDYEDGGLWEFYRRNPKGKYQRLFAVHPAMIDPTRPGRIFWGYAWNIEDIVLAPGRTDLMLQTTFDHHYVHDGNVTPPRNQQAIPYVLFRGTVTQTEMTADAGLHFTPMSLSRVLRRATAKRSLKPTSTGKLPAAVPLQR